MRWRLLAAFGVSVLVAFLVWLAADVWQERRLAGRAGGVEEVLRSVLSAGEVDVDVLAPVLRSAEGLVLGLVLDESGSPLAAWESKDAEARRALLRGGAGARLLEAFRSGREPLRSGGGLVVRTVSEAGRRALLVFRKSDGILPAVAAGMAVFLVLSVASVLRTIPVRTEVVAAARTGGGGGAAMVEAAESGEEGTASMLEKLSFFREVALATNGLTDLGSMLRDLCGVIAAKFPGRNIVFFLEGGGGDEVLRPVRGMVGGRMMDAEELVVAGYGEVERDEAWRLCEEGKEPERIRIPLRDEGTLHGFILLEAREGAEERPDVEELHFVSRQVALAVRNSVLYREAITDGLTGLYVHRYFQIRLEEELRRMRRTGKAFSLFLFDVDHFKRFNDEHGHQAGDFVLKELASTVRACVRSSDLCFRYGGEEMGVLFPETALEEGLGAAEKVRSAVAGREFVYGGKVLRVTVSGGVAEARPGMTAVELVEACDRALYRAKAEGRNRVLPAEVGG